MNDAELQMHVEALEAKLAEMPGDQSDNDPVDKLDRLLQGTAQFPIKRQQQLLHGGDVGQELDSSG